MACSFIGILLLGTALVIPPLQTIEQQMIRICGEWGIECLNLSAVPQDEIGEQITTLKPKILISSIEKISDPGVQKQLLNIKCSYIAIDEAQVIRVAMMHYFNALNRILIKIT